MPRSIASGDGDDTPLGDAGNDRLHGDAGNDLFVFSDGGGSDTLYGGAGGGWVDTVHLQDSDGSAYSGGWTYVLGSSVVDAGANHVTFTDDASDSITFEDGSMLSFTELEQIAW